MVNGLTRYEKVSLSLKQRFAEVGHPCSGKPGHSQSKEQTDKTSAALKAFWDVKGRKTDEQKKARRKANVYAYRARKRNAIPEDADLALIRKIYEHCPDGYHVDHIVALANNGLHHQDNLQYLPISENCRKGKGDKYDFSLAIQWSTYIPR